MTRKKAVAYVDGMNLYYGAVKYNPQYKWLDVQALLENLFSAYDISLIRYYTAKIKPRFQKDNSPLRQLVYLDALETRPKIRITWGVYSRHTAYRRIDDTHGLSNPNLFRPSLNPQETNTVGRILSQAQTQQPPDRPFVLVRVRKDEEKGSDVNLATDLIMDTQVHRNCDTAIIVTNDSDFTYPIAIVTASSVEVILVNPFVGNNPDARGLNALKGVSRRRLKIKHLSRNQLRDPVVTSNGRRVYKPQVWI